ncbi:hypothetical protein QAD02_015103 [Eretmocerus hayati]|uniref:Uncharacterized protein n=1 Tax=Eretmocerus hayati TaxID=131215 RepID=A0ACC2P8Y4_9HYME|nr:hypothetical protein QAD02_015103 [Eretmocerus hayati]
MIFITRKCLQVISTLLHKHYVSGGGHTQDEIFKKLSSYCGKSVHNYSEDESDPLKWDFYNSFYFAYTVVSTIGYGNLAPTNMMGRVLMVLYALIGIPINGILLAHLGEFFGQTFVTAVRRYKTYKQNQNDYSKKSLSSLEKRKFSLAMQIFMYLIPGFVMFIFFPAFLFSHFEGWTYDEAVYYAFVTLTTIGFGDYVAGQDNSKGEGIWFGLYKIFLICWISFGLGYIVMIMTFIGRGMTSKKIARLEHKLALKLKHTQSKIWNEFNEDVSYLRRVFNEIQFYKVKTVYVDEFTKPHPPLPRAASFPDLRELVYGGLELPTPPCPRRRANSEVVPAEVKVARVVSESDLQRIDKNATFAAHAMVQPAELLARLVNILGYIPPPPPPDDDEMMPPPAFDPPDVSAGVQGFSDKEILASEKFWNTSTKTKWELGGDATPKPYRSRATSEVRLDRSELFSQPSACEWTWSGPGTSSKIQEMMRAQKSAKETEGKDTVSGKSRFLPSGKAFLPRWIRLLKKPSVCNSGTTGTTGTGVSHQPDGSFGQDDVEAQRDLYASGNAVNLTYSPSGGTSEVSQRLQQPVGRGAARRNSYCGADLASSSRNQLTYTPGTNLLLEETSLADFIRAVNAVHSRVGVFPTEQPLLPQEYQPQPRKQMRSASLKPSSLLALFSPPPGHSQSQQNTVTGAASQGASAAAAQAQLSSKARRRFSLRTAPDSATPVYQRRTQLLPPGLSRRFSLRPVHEPGAEVTSQPPRNFYRQFSYNSSEGTEHVHQASSNFARGLDAREGPPAYSAEPYNNVIEFSQRKPFVPMEGAPGVSSPVQAVCGSSGRRFSLRPAQIGVPPAPSRPKPLGSMTGPQQLQTGVTVVPRWKAGLQLRERAQKQLQRRVRAFSLSDVHEEATDRRVGISPLALQENAMTITSVQGQRFAAGPKTVTIVAPISSSRQLSTPVDSHQHLPLQQRYPVVPPSKSFRRCNSDIESVSSQSSSHSSRHSLDHRDASNDSFTGASTSFSIKDSGRHIESHKFDDDDEWDFPPTTDDHETTVPSATSGREDNNGEKSHDQEKTCDVRIDVPEDALKNERSSGDK